MRFALFCSRFWISLRIPSALARLNPYGSYRNEIWWWRCKQRLWLVRFGILSSRFWIPFRIPSALARLTPSGSYRDEIWWWWCKQRLWLVRVGLLCSHVWISLSRRYIIMVFRSLSIHRDVYYCGLKGLCIRMESDVLDVDVKSELLAMF